MHEFVAISFVWLSQAACGIVIRFQIPLESPIGFIDHRKIIAEIFEYPCRIAVA